MDTGSLKGRTALVTGASRGLGAAIATELARHGANVVINYLNHGEDARLVAESLASHGSGVMLAQADVSKPADVRRAVDQAIERFGGIDVLVNNAGITGDRTLRKMTDADWAAVLDTNLSGVFHCTRAVLDQMIARRRGTIVNVASIVGQTGAYGQANYAASKAGIIGLTKSCAIEVARYGITVNALCPGYMDTAMLSAVPPDVQEVLLKRIPLGRFGSPEDVARYVRFLATEGGYVTGQAINVNGGLLMS
jgi:3-oxoacyl-(acyl-carrier-protein) reductase